MQIIKLPFKVKREILACGADVKGRFCFAKGNCAYISDEFGDLSEVNNMQNYQKGIEKFRRVFKLKPQIIACDLHPGYFSTEFAQDYAIRNTRYAIRYIQHHHAHIAGCMLDNKIRGGVIGVSFDGTGFGTDGKIWGGEFLLADLNKIRRISYLDYVAMPGGDVVVREPWRMALSYLYKSYKDKFLNLNIPFLKRLNKQKSMVLIQMIRSDVNSPLSSSMGRFFDGVSSLVGVRDRIDYEAEAAIELERIADEECRGRYEYKVKQNNSTFIIKVEEIIKAIVEDLNREEKRSVISSKFHNTIADIVKDTVFKVSKEEGAKRIVFSGGVFQNKYLVARLRELFAESDLKVYFHKNFPTTDAGIALGQIAVANTM